METILEQIALASELKIPRAELPSLTPATLTDIKTKFGDDPILREGEPQYWKKYLDEDFSFSVGVFVTDEELTVKKTEQTVCFQTTGRQDCYIFLSAPTAIAASVAGISNWILTSLTPAQQQICELTRDASPYELQLNLSSTLTQDQRAQIWDAAGGFPGRPCGEYGEMWEATSEFFIDEKQKQVFVYHQSVGAMDTYITFPGGGSTPNELRFQFLPSVSKSSQATLTP
jgi:hypothetical protein